ncbi:MAG TPA: chemotaxis protein CheW [Burkholderiales bacterium]|nr:chemotaxis protein CheW [Burkholderiales bacterium]
MAKRVSLREFQENLASRLKAAAGEPASSARLSFEAEGTLWLLRLESSGELLPVPQIDRVPLTRTWFLGVANVRGMLFGVTDFSAFIAGAPTRRGSDNRLLLVGQPHGINAALLVTRLTGLLNLAEFEPLETQGGPGEQWVERAWRDRDGRAWRELDTGKLLAHRDFLDVAAP